MSKSKIIYQDQPTVYARFDHPQAHEYIEYKSFIQIKDIGKQPVTIELEFSGIRPSTPMPPDKHIIKASDLIELYVKLARWFGKYGYIIK